MEPLVEVLRRYVMRTDKLHGDDTPLPVLAPGTGRTKIGRFWTYVRDSRPAGDPAPAAVWFTYSPDRKGEHPQRHLAKLPRHPAGGRVCRLFASSTGVARFRRRPASPIFAVSFMTWCRPTSPRSLPKLSSASPPSTRSKRRFAAARPKSAAKSATPAHDHCWKSMRQWLEESLVRLAREVRDCCSDPLCAGPLGCPRRYLDDGRIELGRVEMWRGGLGLA